MDPAAALALCRELSGFDDVSPRFAAAAFDRVEKEFGTDAVLTLGSLVGDGGMAAIDRDDALREVVEQLLTFLYTGFTDAMSTDDGVPENHFESLMWRAVNAHPPALSGGYFGHWHYPPEDRS